MRIIYLFKRNDYAAILAAYLHLKKHPPEKLIQPSLNQMQLYYLGIDESRRAVYLLKTSVQKNILMNILHGLGNIFNEDLKIHDLKEFDGIIPYYLQKYNFKNYRKALEDYINENNI